MEKIKTLAMPVLLLLLFTSNTFAEGSSDANSQSTALVLTLEYADDLGAVSIAVDGETVSPILGMALPVNALIETRQTAVELRVEQAGSIIRINPNSKLSSDSYNFDTEQNPLVQLSLLGGKLRAQVRPGGPSDSLRIRTPAALGGVRGTDFVLVAKPDEKDWICVQEGTVAYTRVSDQTTIEVTAGTFASALADDFVADAISTEELSNIFADVAISSTVEW